MGGCFSSVSVSVVFFFDSKSKSNDDDDDAASSSSSSSSSASARVISVNGDLREYPTPFTVSQLLQSMAIRDNNTSTMAINSSSSYFVCNSDCLYYDDYIPALDSDEFLQPNQIYFLLPKTKLQYKLSASDMAALAVKATLALQNSPSSSAAAAAKQYHQNKKKKTRISPVVLVDQHQHINAKSIEETKSFLRSSTTTTNSSKTTKTTKTTSPPLISRSGSIRKLQRYSSKRAKMAVRSFRLRLTTIYEGSIL